MKRLQRLFARLRGKPSEEQEALEGFQRAIESLKRANLTTEEALTLVDQLQADLARARSELQAYHASSLEADLQLAELERIGSKKSFF